MSLSFSLKFQHKLQRDKTERRMVLGPLPCCSFNHIRQRVFYEHHENKWLVFHFLQHTQLEDSVFRCIQTPVELPLMQLLFHKSKS